MKATSTTAPAAKAIRSERHERHCSPFELTRADFVRQLGGGLIVVLAPQETHPPAIHPPATAAAGYPAGGRGGPAERRGRAPGAPQQEVPPPGRSEEALPQEIGVWIHVGSDGAVTVYTGKVEVGQNIRTSLSQAIAEELHAPLASLRLVMADTDLTPFDRGTSGSRTTPVMAAQLRRVAGATRELLMELAARQWQVEAVTVSVVEGRVMHSPTGRSLSFGELARGLELIQTVSVEPATTPADQWNVAGQPTPKVSGWEMVTGAHRFASDVMLPGMWYGKVVRPAAMNAALETVDTREAEAVPGAIIVRDGSFLGAAGPDPQSAERAAAAVRAEWSVPAQPSHGELYNYLKQNAPGEEGSGRGATHAQGSIEEGLAAADHKLQRTYTIAYIAHAPLEPRAAVAAWRDGGLTVWTGTQRPFGVRQELAEVFEMPEERVRVIVPDTGSGYGGKHTGEAAIEAARLAKAAGHPVKLVWTREEEFTWAYFRPAGVIEVRSGVSSEGTLTAWEFHNYNSGGSAIRTLYEVPHQHVEFHPTRSPLRQGSYRALAATANHFARESHVDELAAAIGMDSLSFRLKNLQHARLRAVLEAAASQFGWGRSQPAAGNGFGIAGGCEKGSYVATCAEVVADPSSDRLKVQRLVTAFECGAIVNPAHLKSQVEGCLLMGLGGALYEAIQFEEGKILNPRFSEYRVPRFSDLPVIEVVLLDRKDLPSVGAGETPIVAVAPAVASALFQATGARLRSLPLIPQGIKAALEESRTTIERAAW